MTSREIMILGEGARVYDKPNLSTLERIARIKDDVLIVNSFLEDYSTEHFSKEQLILLKESLEAINKKLLLSIENVDAKIQLQGFGPKKKITLWQKMKNYLLRKQAPTSPVVTSWNTGILETRPEVIRALKK